MTEDQMLKCSITFVLGFLVFCMTRGDGLSVGGVVNDDIDNCLEKSTTDQKNILKNHCVDLLSNYHKCLVGTRTNPSTNYCTPSKGYCQGTDSGGKDTLNTGGIYFINYP